jgi:membrane fusion protein (multidrug efflux system)
MARRMFITVAVLVVVIASIAFIKYRQIQVAIAQGSSFVPPPESVTTVIAQEVSWQGSLNAIGTVVAVNGVMVSADLPGMVEEILFESGSTVRAGEVLVRLDTRQEHAQLAAAEAQRDLAMLNLERARDLLEKGAVSQSDYDQVDAQARSANAQVDEIAAVIDRKTIRAPFEGVLGIRQVNLGQYLAGGDPVVQLQKRAPIYVNFSVPQQDAAALKPGTEVKVTAVRAEGVAATGRITAVNSVIDPSTRNVEAQATFANKDGALRPGMFVEVELVLSSSASVIALPASVVNYAPYGNSVFVVEDVTGPDGTTYRGVRQQFVKLGGGRGDQIAVLSGVKPGEEIVSSGVFKLRPGAAVQVNNEVQPSDSATPKPGDS